MRDFAGAIIPGLLVLIIIQGLCIAFVRAEHPVDALEYLRFSENLYKHGIYSYDGVVASRDRQPLYPLLLLVFYWALGRSEFVVKIVQFFIGLSTYLLMLKIYLLTIKDRRILLPGILLACYLPLWINCVFILTESLTFFFLVAALYAFIKGVYSESPAAFAVSGGIFALSVLTRPNCVAPLVLGIPLIIYLYRDKMRWLRRVALYVITALLVLLPWAVRNKLSTGSLTPLSSEGLSHLIFSAGPDTPERRDAYYYATVPERDSLATNLHPYSILFNGIIDDPLAFTWRGIERILWVWSYFPGTRDYFGNPFLWTITHLAQWVLLALALFGLIRAGSRERLLLLLLPVSLSLILFFAVATSRYILPAMPTVVILAVFGLTELFRRLGLIRKLTGAT